MNTISIEDICNEAEGVIQQEIITDSIDGNQDIITVIQVNEEDASQETISSTQTDIGDLSALATVAEYVPLLKDINNIAGNQCYDISAANMENESTVFDDLDNDSKTESLEDSMVLSEESAKDMSVMVTPGEYFVTTTFDEMLQILQDYFDRTATKFVVQKRTKDFGLKDENFDLMKHRIQWEDTKTQSNQSEYSFLPFDGVPHITVGHYVMHCQFGSDHNALQKEKKKLLREKDAKKTRNVKNPTKKCGCPAKINIKQVIKFPEFKVNKKTERRKRSCAGLLKEQYQRDKSKITTEMFFMGRLPVMEEHKFHELLEGREFAKENVHRDLIIKAQELYFLNRSITDIAAELQSYVVNELFYKQEPPDKSRRKYNPTTKDLRNYIGKIRQLERFNKEDIIRMDSLISSIHKEENNTKVLFNSEQENILDLQDTSSEDENTHPNQLECLSPSLNKNNHHILSFLFCYQTQEHQRLLKRYGATAFLTEVNPSLTVKRALTFKFFVVFVQTNVDFQPVGFIVFSKRRNDGLKDGFSTLKNWNSSWAPKYLFIDSTDEMINASTKVFPDVPYFLNIHSCESQWLDYLLTPSNELSVFDDDIMVFLRNMASSFSENSLSLAASSLEESSVWLKSINLRTWFQSEWLPIAKKWVGGYRPEDLFVFDHLKYDLTSCLQVFVDLLSDSTKGCSGFVGMVESLHRITVNEEYAKYIIRNREQNDLGNKLRVEEHLTDGMIGIPSFIANHLYSTCKEASEQQFEVVEGTQVGVFHINTDASEPEVDNAAEETNAESEPLENVVAPKPENEIILEQDQVMTADSEQLQPQTENGITTEESNILSNVLENCLLQTMEIPNMEVLPNSSSTENPSMIAETEVVDSDPSEFIASNEITLESNVEVKETSVQQVVFAQQMPEETTLSEQEEMVNSLHPPHVGKQETIVQDAKKLGTSTPKPAEKALPNDIELASLEQIDDENSVEEPNKEEESKGLSEREDQQIDEAVNNMNEYTVSFGDSTSYPFCTCSHWQQHKLPCHHMFHVFQAVPGWGFDMLSPVYRMNNKLHFDHSCIETHQKSKISHLLNKAVQTSEELPCTVQTPQNRDIFQPISSLQMTGQLHRQVSDLLFHLNKSSFLFKDIVTYKRLRNQLTDLFKASHVTLTNDNPSKPPNGPTHNNSVLTTLKNAGSIQRAQNIDPKKVKVKVAPRATSLNLTQGNAVNIEEINRLLAAVSQLVSEDEIIKANEANAIIVNNSDIQETFQESSPSESLTNINDETQSKLVITRQSPDKSASPISTDTNDTSISISETPTTIDSIINLQPLIHPGIKRDTSQILTQTENDKMDDQSLNNKVSILEYLPLLKKKCVTPEDIANGKLEQLASQEVAPLTNSDNTQLADPQCQIAISQSSEPIITDQTSVLSLLKAHSVTGPKAPSIKINPNKTGNQSNSKASEIIVKNVVIKTEI
ncbi:uncharacterized protein [Clytia hemisphaerica]|uniref:SWIM-type domain-containing protein n=1 Tax=Clytia hemisphaerica TaxID=252671 RepID=A0A7M5X6H2_9CNID